MYHPLDGKTGLSIIQYTIIIMITIWLFNTAMENHHF